SGQADISGRDRVPRYISPRKAVAEFHQDAQVSLGLHPLCQARLTMRLILKAPLVPWRPRPRPYLQCVHFPKAILQASARQAAYTKARPPLFLAQIARTAFVWVRL